MKEGDRALVFKSAGGCVFLPLCGFWSQHPSSEALIECAFLSLSHLSGPIIHLLKRLIFIVCIWVFCLYNTHNVQCSQRPERVLDLMELQWEVAVRSHVGGWDLCKSNQCSELLSCLSRPSNMLFKQSTFRSIHRNVFICSLSGSESKNKHRMQPFFLDYNVKNWGNGNWHCNSTSSKAKGNKKLGEGNY